MNTIQVDKKGVKVDVSVFLFKNDGVYYAYCPELDLTGYDYTEDGARQSFDFVLKDYLDYTLEKGTLEQDLLKHGWKKAKSGNVTEPTPAAMMRGSKLKNVFGMREFRKYSVPITL